MFKVAKREVGDVEPLEYYPSDAALTIGSAATLGSGGKLSKASSTVRPSHIVMGEKNEDGMFPAMKVMPSTTFEVQSTATVADTLIGNKVTLGDDADTVTATTTSGVFTVDWTDGATTNSTVRGHFA